MPSLVLHRLAALQAQTVTLNGILRAYSLTKSEPAAAHFLQSCFTVPVTAIHCPMRACNGEMQVRQSPAALSPTQLHLALKYARVVLLLGVCPVLACI